MAKKMNFGPGFSMDEIPYWIGFAAGVVICGVTLRSMEMDNRWVMLIGCMVSGFVVGMIFEVVWRSMNQQPPEGPPPDEGRFTGPG